MRAIPYIIRKLHDFVTLPPLGGPGVVVRCFIERNRKFANSLYPRYMLYADYEDGQGRPLLIAVSSARARGARRARARESARGGS